MAEHSMPRGYQGLQEEEQDEEKEIIIYNPKSLLQCSLDTIVCDGDLTEICVSLGLPSTIHVMLFTATASLIPKRRRKMRQSMKCLVSTWPLHTMDIRKVLGTVGNVVIKTGRNIGIDSFIIMLIEGLVNMRPKSKLERVDFTGQMIPALFQLPWLFLSEEERCSDAIMAEIHANCKKFAVSDDDNLNSVLAWKLKDMNAKHIFQNYHGKDKIEITVECETDFTDWISMIDEMIGLILHTKTPFWFRVSRLQVDNFHQRQRRHFKWFLSMIDKKGILYLTVSGFRRSMAILFSYFQEEFSQFENLHVYGTASTGPNVLVYSNPGEPSEMDELSALVSVHSHWNSLSELYYNDVSLANKLGALLMALKNPLKVLYCYKCYLKEKDIEDLADSHHCTGMEALTLEKNKLQYMGHHLCSFIEKSPNLKNLNIKDTLLTEEEKVNVLCALQGCGKVETLVMYDKESIESVEGYETMIQLACIIPSMKHFYIYPLKHEEFDAFYREEVEQRCEEIQKTNGRKDLNFYY